MRQGVKPKEIHIAETEYKTILNTSTPLTHDHIALLTIKSQDFKDIVPFLLWSSVTDWTLSFPSSLMMRMNVRTRVYSVTV